MRRVWRGAFVGAAATIAAAGAAGAAGAADKLAIAPPAAWVTSVAVPADDGKAGEAPIKLLLRDEQDDLQPGRITRYIDSVFKVQTPQGLPAGAVVLAWNPDTQQATVHKLQIRRDGKTIDVLASGQSFTVIRREQNLESAVLDGQLTASIQPEGLQVGDVVDFAASVTTSDPALGAHLEQVGAAWNGLPIARAHLRVQWPASVALRIQPDGGLAPPKVVRKGDLSSIELAMDDVQPLVLPKGAPARYQYGRMLEMSDAASWSGIVALIAPLYAKAEALPAGGPLQAEIARIKAASPDPGARAEAALALVQDRVRYVFLGINDGGLVPADAETTWSRRFGDCKGKTVLLLALLHALGIEANPVLVNSTIGDGLDRRLPEIGLFDHVLVRAVIGGRSYWLDGTRVGDRALDRIETPNVHWGLPLVAGNAALVPLVPEPYTTPQTEVAIRIDASAGLTLPAPVHIERVVHGDEAVVSNLQLASVAGDARDRALRQFWHERYDFAEPKTVSATFDADRREFRMVMDGTTKMDWNEGWYEADHVWVGYRADFSRDDGPDKAAPYAVPYPSYTHVVETILLPSKVGLFSITKGADVDETVAGMEYHRHAKIDGDRFVVEQSDRSVSPEFPAAEAAGAQETLRALAKKGVFINRPGGYAGTPAEVQAMLAANKTASDYIGGANALLIQGRRQESIAMLDRAIALEPKNARALAMRAFLRFDASDRAASKADLAAATAAAPNDPAVLVTKAAFAFEERRYADAIVADTAVLAATQNNLMALEGRASAYAASGQDDLALADAAAALKLAPGAARMHLLRANILRHKGDRAEVAREADAIVAAGPKDGDSLVTAGKIYAAVGRQDEAMRAIDAALAIKPEAWIYLNRFYVRPKTDVAGRQADLDSALKLEPSLADALAAKADLQGERGDWRGAAATLTTLLAKQPDEAWVAGQRGIAYAKAEEHALAAKDFDAARARAKTAAALNALCWNKATAGVALERALAECDAALALSPDAVNIRDSRAFVLLRLGRIDEALAEYGRVLAKQPSLAASLYGRALAEARKGDRAAADRDIAAALKVDPHAREEFESYGMSMTASPATSERTAGTSAAT